MSTGKTSTNRKIFDRRFTILFGIQILVLSVVFIDVFTWIPKKTMSAVDPHKYREVAGRLLAAGVLEEAIAYYERFLNSAYEVGESKASVAFSLGELYESLNRFEKALSWYYMVELFDPHSRHKLEASKRIVSLLEKLGNVAASKRELRRATSLESGSQGSNDDHVKNSQVLAKVDGKNIYLHDLDEAIGQLPPQMKDAFKSKDKKVNLLRKLVADEVLSQKAVRLGLDRRPDFIRKFNQIKNRFLVEQMIQSEVESKIKIDESDLSNYFEVNKDKYTQREQAQVSLIKVKSKSLAQSILSKLKSGQRFSALAKKYSVDEKTKKEGGRVSGFVVKGRPFERYSKDVSDEILSTRANKWTRPLLSGGHYSIFWIRSKDKEKKPQYSEVKSKIEFDYRMEKTQKIYKELIEKSIAGDRIKLFTERIK